MATMHMIVARGAMARLLPLRDRFTMSTAKFSELKDAIDGLSRQYIGTQPINHAIDIATLIDLSTRRDRPEILDNDAMSAGERAFEILEKLGLIAVQPPGYRFARWTDEGRRFVESTK